MRGRASSLWSNTCDQFFLHLTASHPLTRVDDQLGLQVSRLFKMIEDGPLHGSRASMTLVARSVGGVWVRGGFRMRTLMPYKASASCS